jgi:S-adenosylmethionine:tRNA ribosyltransferase-isomerase
VGDLLDSPGAVSTVVAGDVTSPSHRTALVDAAVRHGSLDLHVNNASTLGPTPLPRLARYPMADLRHVYEVNVLAPLALVQEALPHLRRARRPVVALSSDAAVEAYDGRTDLMISPERGVRVVDGMLTGWHEPASSHLMMLEAVAGRELLQASYGAAVDQGFRWHEFGDTHLILP